jgi:hypothetical protein
VSAFCHRQALAHFRSLGSYTRLDLDRIAAGADVF